MLFFFSSRRRHTRCGRDWSSDVCSSDLLAAALLVNARLIRWKPLFRSAFFAPWVTTLVAVALVWRYLYHPQYGLLNAFLGLVGVGPIDWLGNPRWAMPAIILMSVLTYFGYNMLIFLAGLQAIPPQLYEAAEL